MRHEQSCARLSGWGLCDCAGLAPTNLDRALAVDRSRWQVGLEAWGRWQQGDRMVLWTVVEVDWNRGAGPILCEWYDEETGATVMAMLQPWELTPDDDIPKTLDEVFEFLGI